MTVEQRVRARVPLPVWVLAGTMVILATSEFVVTGLLPVIADDLDVSIPHAGLLLSTFAVSMAVGAPLAVVLTLRLPRRASLVAALAVFVVGSAVTALAPGYGVLLAARVVTAVATGMFWSVTAVIGVSLAAPGARARALATLFGGATIANVAGLPLGTYLGQQLGWRATFWTLTALAAVALPVAWVLLSGTDDSRATRRLADEIVAFAQGRLWLALATTVAFQSGMLTMYGYIVPLLTDVTGLARSAVPFMLAGFGAGNVLGVYLVGRFADTQPWWTLCIGLTSTVATLAAIAATATNPYLAVPLVLLLGVLGFSLATPLNARVLALAAAAPTLASSVSNSAFQTGTTIGPLLGGLVISAGWGYRATSWLGAALMLTALMLALLSRQLDRRAVRSAA